MAVGWLKRPSNALESGGAGVEVFEPEGEVELSGCEIPARDEAEDGVLDFGGEFGEGVAGAGASNGVEFVEAELAVERERGRRGGREGLADAGGEGGVEVGCQIFRFGLEDERGDGLERGELRRAQVLSDVDCAVVDKLLETKARSGLSDA
jgi:hypothetical protein